MSSFPMSGSSLSQQHDFKTQLVSLFVLRGGMVCLTKLRKAVLLSTFHETWLVKCVYDWPLSHVYHIRKSIGRRCGSRVSYIDPALDFT